MILEINQLFLYLTFENYFPRLMVNKKKQVFSSTLSINCIEYLPLIDEMSYMGSNNLYNFHILEWDYFQNPPKGIPPLLTVRKVIQQ